MILQRIAPICFLIAASCPSVVFALEAPSLSKGAVITLSKGKEHMSASELRSYRRQFRQEPPEITFTIKMGESFKVGKTECYLPGCSLNPVSVNIPDNPEVTCVLYRHSVSSAELLVDIVSDTGRTRPRFLLRRELNRSDSICQGTGLGSGAWIEFSRNEGNTWYGKVRGCLYNADNPRGIAWVFNNSPITVVLPPEGEDWSKIGVPDTNAEQTDENTENSELADETIQQIIGKRLQLMVNNPVDETLVNELYAEQVTRLSDGKSIPRSELLEKARSLVKKWPRRGVKLLAVGRKNNKYELIMASSYSNYSNEEISAYSKLTFLLDENGRINGMDEELSPKKGNLSHDVLPFEYKGKGEWITVE